MQQTINYASNYINEVLLILNQYGITIINGVATEKHRLHNVILSFQQNLFGS